MTTTSQGSFSSLTSPTANQPKTFNWVVTATDRAKYDALFDSLSPVGGKLPGIKVFCDGFVPHSVYSCDTLCLKGERSLGQLDLTTRKPRENLGLIRHGP